MLRAFISLFDLPYAKFVYGLMGAVMSFMAPIQVFIIWMLIFVGVDLVSGILAAKKRGEKLESKKLRATINKMTWYFMFIVLAQGLDIHVVPWIDMHLASMVSAIICGVELYSVLENAYSITGNRVFYMLTQFTVKKIKEVTDCDISETK